MSTKARDKGTKPKGLAQSLGRRIANLRKAQSLTQEELAGKAGLGVKYVGELENGRRDVRITTLARLARALGIQPAGLFEFTEADQTVAQVQDMLRGRDDVFRGHLVRVVREILLLTDSRQ